MPEFVVHPLIKENSVEQRLYQEVLVARVLEKGNSLVVAPTALGKTIVAVMIAAHLLQKKPEAKILLVAPTKPLAVQHKNSFTKFMKLEEEKIVLLTGSTPSSKREALWQNASIISATPQAIENDLIQGKLSLKDVNLIVFDEAHRAVRNYSYVFLAQNYMKQALQPLILALTASPGGEEERIQEVCKNLFIQNIEIKSEGDEDVKPYTHEIENEWIKVDLPAEFLEIKKLLKGFMREQLLFLKKLGYAKGIYPNMMRRKDLIELQVRIRRDLIQRAKTHPAIYMAASRCAALLKIAHAELLLETQGISSLQEYFAKMFSASQKSGATKAGKYILGKEEIQKAIALTKALHEKKIIHPKVEKLQEVLSKQFAGNPESRVIVFNHYRDSAKFLEKQLNSIAGIKAKRFVGQAMKERDKGMSQKEQIQAIADLKEGKYNTLIGTSVIEEGLDIPAVDLVVFFEPVPSEIRAIQRRGRTGRLAKGKAVILMARNTRDESFYWSAVSKEKAMKKVLHSMKGMPLEKKKMEAQTTLTKFNEEAKNKIIIFVDTREQASNVVRELSKREDVFIKVKQLELGDYVLSDQVIVERKTVEDFLQSMIDGRLFNQLVDMASNYEKPLMLIEGRQEEIYALRNIHGNAIKGALTSIALDYHVPIIFTKDLEESVSFLYLIAKREQLGKDRDIRLRIGRKGLTQNELQQFIVESLPLIGPTMAKSLLKHFGSIRKLFLASEEKLQKVENIGEKKASEIRKIIDAEWKEE